MRKSLGWVKTSTVAWLMAGVYLWLSGVLQLTHTDDFSILLPVSSTAQTAPYAHHGAAPGPEQPCLAHEWSGASHTASPSAIAIDLGIASFPHRSDFAARALHLRCFDHNPLRGPPTLLG